MKGNTRQGLKCKLCRMNVHLECQDKVAADWPLGPSHSLHLQVVKCQPKAKFSRMKSGSEIGDDDSNTESSRLCIVTEGKPFSGLSLAGSLAPDQKRQSFMNSKNASTESQALLTPPNECQSGEASPIRRKMGGSYSRYTGAAPLHRGLTIEGDLVDSSGRKINTSGSVGNGNGVPPDISRPSSVGPPALTMRKWPDSKSNTQN